MQKIVSSTEAKSRFGTLLKWIKEHEVIIRVHGEPEAVLISYEDYRQIEELRERERRRIALETLRKLREEVTAQVDLSQEEAYVIAGMSPGVARRIVEYDQKRASS